MKFFIIASFVFFILFSCNSMNYQSNLQGYNQKPEDENTCYSQFFVPTTNAQLFLINIHTGDVSEANTSIKKIILKEEETVWVKKKIDPSCQSIRPEDCEIHCLETRPKIEKSFRIVDDIELNKNYEPTFFLFDENGRNVTQKWYQTICEEELSKELIIKVQDKLRQKGVYNKESNGMMTLQTQMAIMEYQMINKLPVGGLSEPTIKSLSVY